MTPDQAERLINAISSQANPVPDWWLIHGGWIQTVVTVFVGFGAAILGGVIAAKATRKATRESIEEAKRDAHERQLEDNWSRLHTVAYAISEAMENIVHSVHVPSEKAMVGERVAPETLSTLSGEFRSISATLVSDDDPDHYLHSVMIEAINTFMRCDTQRMVHVNILNSSQNSDTRKMSTSEIQNQSTEMQMKLDTFRENLGTITKRMNAVVFEQQESLENP